MGLGLRTSSSVRRCLHHPFAWLFVALAAHAPLPAAALDFDVRVISREGLYNRDPVISETGLAAWMYYNTNVNNSAQSHIAVLDNGERREITEELTGLYGANKPQVHSNQVLFTANTRSIEGNITWTLVEVPTRDEGEQPELTALYSGFEVAGEQQPAEGETTPPSTNEAIDPALFSTTNEVRRHPSGEAEVWSWRQGDADVQRITHDRRNDFAPSFWGNLIAWQKAKGWPFGWEIMVLAGDVRMQLTTNFYYDIGPKVHSDKVVWYGWDGFDYEIFLFDAATTTTVQITSNRYDDVAPTVWGDTVVWEGYTAVEADIFMWRNGEITRISDNPNDDLYPRVWGNKVVWQGFDGDDFEIYLYEIGSDRKPIKLTSNGYDDTNPDIYDDLVVWMGYHDNWDAEIFYMDVSSINDPSNLKAVQLTNNEEDDRDPRTVNRRIIWVSDNENDTSVLLAEPK